MYPVNCLHRLFACDSDEKDVQHDFLLQAQTIMLRAVGMMDHLLHDVCSLSAVQEVSTTEQSFETPIKSDKGLYESVLLLFFFHFCFFLCFLIS